MRFAMSDLGALAAWRWIALVLCACAPCSAGARQSFEIGALLGPVASPTDYNTQANWQKIHDCFIDSVTGAESFLDKSANESAIAHSVRNHVKLLIADPAVYDRRTLDVADFRYWESVLPAYVHDARVRGFLLRDEPTYGDLEGLANSYRRIKQFNPDWEVLLNLALAGGAYSTEEPCPLVISNPYSPWGKYLELGHRIGQSMTIPKGVSRIADIELRLEPVQWPAGEELTLVLWNGPERETKLAEARLGASSPTTNTLRFAFAGGAPVVGGTRAYFELSHAGHQPGAVGRFGRSLSDSYPGGTAFENGEPADYDLWFKVHAQRTAWGDGYENVIDDWVNLSGADRILSTTVYPFRGNSDAPEYFSALERLRGRALAHDVPFGLFLQLVQVNDVRSGAVTYRDPNPNMMRFNAYSALSYGARSLQWFLYWPPTRVNGYFEVFSQTPVLQDGATTAKYDTLKRLNRELHGLGLVLRRLTSHRVFHSGTSLPAGTHAIPEAFFVHPSDASLPLVFGSFRDASGRAYLMVVNRSYADDLDKVQLKFERPPNGMTEVAKLDAKEVAAQNDASGVLRLSLAAGEGRLFAMARGYRPYSNLAATARVTASSSRESTVLGLGLGYVHDDIRVGEAGANGWSSEPVSDSKAADGSELQAWVAFELEHRVRISTVTLYPFAGGVGFPEEYRIETSTDGRTWRGVVWAKASLTNSTRVRHSFPASYGRFVRILGTRLPRVDGQPRMQFAEIEIHER